MGYLSRMSKVKEKLKDEEDVDLFRDVGYDINLEDQYKNIENSIWINEELQLQSISSRKTIYNFLANNNFHL